MTKTKVYLADSKERLVSQTLLARILEKELKVDVLSLSGCSSSLLENSTQMIKDADVIIATGKASLDTAFELGVAHALKKPIFYICEVSGAPTGHLLTAPMEVFFPRRKIIQEIAEALDHVVHPRSSPKLGDA